MSTGQVSLYQFLLPCYSSIWSPSIRTLYAKKSCRHPRWIVASQCQALHLSDQRRCTDEATHANGSFCYFHARQAYGLYKGYKRRNAQLNYLTTHPPPALENQVLTNLGFHDIEDEVTLKLVHDHIF